jgi:hypothetical protein
MKKDQMKMMNDFQIEKGAIWEICYFTSDVMELDPDLEQTIIDNETRGVIQDTFDPSPGLTPSEYSQLFVQHFMKTRTKTREIVDENKKRLVRYRILSQVGNFECLQELENVGKLHNFHSWENPSIVDFFKTLTKQYLNE